MNQPNQKEMDQPNVALANTWGKYREFAASARKRRKKIVYWRYLVLLLGIMGAIFGVLSQQTSQLQYFETNLEWFPTVLGWFSALSLGLATYFGKELVSPEHERAWIRCRSVAEALKSKAFLYVTNTPPYHQADKDSHLAMETEKLLEKASDLHHEMLSQNEKLERIPDNPMTMDQYVEKRVKEQIYKYYYPKSNEYLKKMEQFKKIGLVLGIIAVVLGVLGSNDGAVAWVAVISTITASIAAFTYGNRFQYLIVSYQATGNRLEMLNVRWKISEENNIREYERNQFINDCEEAISIENSAWMAELTRKVSKKQGCEDTTG